MPDINRPALQLAGYLEHFATERVQIIGYVEYTYLMHLTREEKIKSYERIYLKGNPVCCIYHTDDSG